LSAVAIMLSMVPENGIRRVLIVRDTSTYPQTSVTNPSIEAPDSEYSVSDSQEPLTLYISLMVTKASSMACLNSGALMVVLWVIWIVFVMALIIA